MKIPFLERHIQEGFPGFSKSCPIALAINDALGYLYYARVRPGYIWIHRAGLGDNFIVKEIETPPIISEFVNKIDAQALNSKGIPVGHMKEWPPNVPRFSEFELSIDMAELEAEI